MRRAEEKIVGKAAGAGRRGRPAGPPHLGLGIDAGGTYTDVVIFDFAAGAVRQKAKSLTTKWDYAVGIEAALDRIEAGGLAAVDLVAVSTTLATNAIVEGRGQKVGLLLMPPYGWRDPPNFTHELYAIVDGQLEIDGREIAPVNPEQVRRVVREMLDRQGVRAFAVAGYASHVNPAHEQQVKAAVRDETDAVVTCSRDISAGLNYRIAAETAVLNAKIIPCLDTFLARVQETIRRRGLTAPLMVVRSDGSLMGLELARQRPVETILSGPAASAAGAAFLTGATDAIVVDIGGTTTDTALIRNGVVRTCQDGATVGRWKTHVEALDMRTLGLGGDSRIVLSGGRLAVGPQRIAPVAWLAREDPRTGKALDWIAEHLDRFENNTRAMEIVCLTPHAKHRPLDAREREVVEQITTRPHSVEELVERLQRVDEQLLPLDRLEEDHIILRCGLTPTDLLHSDGRIVLWDTAAARRICDLYTALLQINRDRLVEQVFEIITRMLAVDLLKTRLADRVDPDTIDGAPAAMALIDSALGGMSEGLSVKIALQAPAVGIGAPARFFLPAAARRLGARTVIPAHAEVANAVGAIISRIHIQRRATIAVDENGRFRAEGLPGTPTFPNIDAAERAAAAHLRELVGELGRQAGAARREVAIEIEDRQTTLKDGERLFVGRIITARLCGHPRLSRTTRPRHKPPAKTGAAHVQP